MWLTSHWAEYPYVHTRMIVIKQYLMPCLHFDICSSSAVALCWLTAGHAITAAPPPVNTQQHCSFYPVTQQENLTAGCRATCYWSGQPLMRRSTISLFMSASGRRGWCCINGRFGCYTKALAYLFAHVKTSLIYELFSTIVPIFDCPLLKCQGVKTNARWPFISQIYEHTVSLLPILLLKNNKWFWCQFC